MNIFGLEIKKVGSGIDKKMINSFQKYGYEFLGNSLNACGEVVVTKDSFYQIHIFTAEAQAYKNKIINWIGKNGIYLTDKNGRVVNNKTLTTSVNNVFKDSTWQAFKDKYFTHNFCSGDIYLYPKKTLDGSITSQVVDSRIVEKISNEYGIISKYKIRAKNVIEKAPSELYNSVVRYNPNNPIYGMSLYQSILYDALSENEGGKRSFYFFKNNAVPNAIFMLDPSITSQEEMEIATQQIKAKFTGGENSSKFLVSGGVKDVKLLNVTNKDLELLGMRDFFIKKMGIVFQIDPRLIGYVNDVGTYSSMREIRKEAQETLKGYAIQFEDDLTNFYKQFIDPNFPFYIKVDSETLDDREFIEENQRKDVELGLTTIERVWNERGYDTKDLPENAKKPLVKSNLQPLDIIGTTI